MKKYVTAVALLVFMAACGNNANEKQTKETPAEGTETTTDITTNPDYEKGLELVSKSDCLTCHKVSEKLIGPSYEDVANKYAGQDTAVQHLSHKIIAGGSGVWGQVPMTPHPNVSQEDAEAMVKYILLLKK